MDRDKELIKSQRGLVRINDDETKVLQAIAAQVHEGGTIVEIGSAFGWSASAMAQVVKRDVKIHCIDPWTLAPQKQQPNREARFDGMAANYPNIIKIKSFSENVEWSDEIDLLFIDGNHSYKAVMQDYLKFSPFVRDTIVFHDYMDERAPGVTQAVDELVVPSGLWEYRTEYRLWIGTRK